jgi:hypothetical protein
MVVKVAGRIYIHMNLEEYFIVLDCLSMHVV